MVNRMLAIAGVAALVAIPGIALADDAPAPAAAAAAPAAPASPHSFTGNIGLFSQYIFRGLTQTNENPAVQGGFDYAYNFGTVTGYVGTWASNISWLADGGNYSSSALENDWYGGFRGNFGATDFSYDAGFLYYYYPGTVIPTTGEKGDTQEIYGLLGWKWLTAKLSYSIGDKIFAVRNGSGTYYLDVSANYPIGESGFTANLHYGDQKYSGTDSRNAGGASNDSLFSYYDWKIGFTYDASKLTPILANVTVGAYYTDTDAKAAGYTLAGKNIGKSQATFFLQKTL
jgi:uncharacterized protein (TIGR02001 family)